MHNKCSLIFSLFGPFRHLSVTICFLLRFHPPCILPLFSLFAVVERFSLLFNFVEYFNVILEPVFFRLVVEAKTILTKLTVTNKGCDDNPSDICEEIREMVSKVQIYFT